MKMKEKKIKKLQMQDKQIIKSLIKINYKHLASLAIQKHIHSYIKYCHCNATAFIHTK